MCRYLQDAVTSTAVSPKQVFRTIPDKYQPKPSDLLKNADLEVRNASDELVFTLRKDNLNLTNKLKAAQARIEDLERIARANAERRAKLAVSVFPQHVSPPVSNPLQESGLSLRAFVNSEAEAERNQKQQAREEHQQAVAIVRDRSRPEGELPILSQYRLNTAGRRELLAAKSGAANSNANTTAHANSNAYKDAIDQAVDGTAGRPWRPVDKHSFQQNAMSGNISGNNNGRRELHTNEIGDSEFTASRSLADFKKVIGVDRVVVHRNKLVTTPSKKYEQRPRQTANLVFGNDQK